MNQHASRATQSLIAAAAIFFTAPAADACKKDQSNVNREPSAVTAVRSGKCQEKKNASGVVIGYELLVQPHSGHPVTIDFERAKQECDRQASRIKEHQTESLKICACTQPTPGTDEMGQIQQSCTEFRAYSRGNKSSNEFSYPKQGVDRRETEEAAFHECWENGKQSEEQHKMQTAMLILRSGLDRSPAQQ